MNTKILVAGAVAAVALTALGLGFRELGGPASAGAEAGELLFPDLRDAVNEVATVEVLTPTGGFEVSRGEEHWGLGSKGGYPVQSGQIRGLVIGMSELETIEAKTSDRSRHHKLGVRDPGDEGSGSKLVTLRDGTGATLASLVIGNVRSTTGSQSVFVRKNGEDQSWLVRGQVEVPADAGGLLDKKILELPRDEIQACETVHPDGEAVLVSKDERADLTFHVRDVPEANELRFVSVGTGMGAALEYLNLEDVMPAADFEAPEEEPVRTSYWTWDDMRVDVAVYEKDEKVYATFRASYDEEGPAREKLPDEAQPEEPSTEEGADPEAPTPKTPDEVRVAAQELNDRLEPWVFEIAAYAKNNFTKRMDDMVKPPEPEEEIPTPGEDPNVQGPIPMLEDVTSGTVDPPADPSTETPTESPGGGDEPPGDEPGSGSDEPSDG